MPPARAFRPDVSGPGYWVFAPARLAGGGVVVVNRGFVPLDANPAAPPGGHAKATARHHRRAALAGGARLCSRPSDEPAHNLWFLRDPACDCRRQRAGAVAPFYVEQEAPVPPGGLPQPGKLDVAAAQRAPAIRGHLVRACARAGGVFAVWAFSRAATSRREDGGQAHDRGAPFLVKEAAFPISVGLSAGRATRWPPDANIMENQWFISRRLGAGA